MTPYNKYIRTLITVLIFITLKINAQEVNVIDKKGTIQTVNNNLVTKDTDAPSNPLEGDVWFDTNTTPNIVKVWKKDTATWEIINDNTPHTGTAGSVFFSAADGTPTENNSQFFWNNSDNRLYLGSPLTGTNKLNVNGAIRATAFNNAPGTFGLPSYRFFDDPNTGMYRIAEDQLGFSTAGVNALAIDATQNVSIPQNLSVAGTYIDSSGDVGTNGQILSSTATGTNWIDPNLVIVENKITNYTLLPEDNGKVFTFDSTTDITLTVPNGLQTGYNISIYQINTGEVTIQGGATILNRLSRFKTAGKDAGAGLISTGTNIFHLTGDLKL